MEPITLRAPEDLLEELSEEAVEHGFSSRSEYIRHILRNRSDTGPVSRNRTDTDPVTRRLDELEQRIEELEAELPRTAQNAERDAQSDSSPETMDTLSDTAPEAGDAVGNPPESSGSIDEILREWRTELQRSNSEEKVEAMVAAGRAALERLQSGEEHRTGGFQDLLQEEYPVPGQDPETKTYQRKTIRPVLNKAEEKGLVEQQDGSWIWRWVGD